MPETFSQDKIRQLLQQNARIVYVDGTRTDTYVETGSPATPFKTVQAAVNYVEASLAPTDADVVIVQVAPNVGGYNETVVIKKSGVYLNGTPFFGTSILRVLVTNATAASIATFVANGGLDDPDTNYGDLVADSYAPTANVVRDLALTGAPYSLLVLGVGPGNEVANGAFDLQSTICSNTVYFRNMNLSDINDGAALVGAPSLRTYNISGVWINNAYVDTYEGDYDSGDDTPAQPQSGLCGNGPESFYSAVTLNGEAIIGGANIPVMRIETHLDLNDDSVATLIVGYIGGNITVEGDATFYLKGTHVQGDITLDNTGGAVACTFDGGAYRGTLTDAGDRLVRSLGVVLKPGEPKVAPEVANDSVYDFWSPPITGTETAVLIEVKLATADGVSTSAAGTYLLDAQRVDWDGGPTLTLQLASTYSLEGLTDQTLTTLVPTAGELVVSEASRTYTVGQQLRLGAVSNNADLTGGNGIVMWPVWRVV